MHAPTLLVALLSLAVTLQALPAAAPVEDSIVDGEAPAGVPVAEPLLLLRDNEKRAANACNVRDLPISREYALTVPTGHYDSWWRSE